MKGRSRGVPWHPLTRAWWNDAWASEMAPQWVHSDIHGLFILAALVDAFWNGAIELAGEIRLQGQRFGLSPLDRSRLHWEIDRAVPPPATGEKPGAPRRPRAPRDSAAVLSVLQGGKP